MLACSNVYKKEVQDEFLEKLKQKSHILLVSLMNISVCKNSDALPKIQWRVKLAAVSWNLSQWTEHNGSVELEPLWSTTSLADWFIICSHDSFTGLCHIVNYNNQGGTEFEYIRVQMTVFTISFGNTSSSS